MEESEERQLKPETWVQVELLTAALRTGSVDDTVRLLLQTRTLSLQVAGMVETLQQVWSMQEPLEVVQRLVRMALDHLEYDNSLLVLLEELEARGMADPVGYLRALVSKETVTSEGLVDYRTLPYSHLVGIETPAAIRERWRRVVWTIMQHNVACKQWDERWYLNVWTVHALAGGRPLALAQYLHEQDPMISAHHLTLELHPNVNRKAITIADELTIGEDPPPEDLWEALRWIEPE